MKLDKQTLFGASEKQQVKFFKFYAKMPMILAIVTMALFFIWGIIDPIVFKDYVSSGFSFIRGKTYYGMMRLKSGFLCWLIWVLIGAVCSVITYLLGRVLYSYKLLHIIYLQKLLGNKVAEENLVDDGM